MAVRRILRKFLLFLLLAVATTVPIIYLMLPGLVENSITRELSAQGFSEISMEVQAVTPWGVKLSKVVARGPLEINLSVVEIDYSPRELFSKQKIRALKIKNAEVNIPLDNLPGKDSLVINKVTAHPVRAAVAKADFLKINCEELVIAGEAVFRDPAQPSLVGLLRVSGMSVRYDSGKILLTRIDGVMPLMINTEGKGATEPGEFIITSGLYQDIPLPEVNLTIQLIAQNKVMLAGICRPLKGAVLSAKGNLGLEADGLKAFFRISLPQFTIEDRTELAALISTLEGNDIGGSLSLEGSIAYASGKISPDLTLGLEEVFVRGRKWDLMAEEISGTIKINSFTPVMTAGAQSIKIGKANVGELRLIDTIVEIETLPEGAFMLRKASSGWGGGRLSCENVFIDPAARGTEVKLNFDRINLGELLDNYASDRAVGEGYLSGYWTIMPQWSPKPRLYAGEGKLWASPQVGWFRIIRDADLDIILGISSGDESGSLTGKHEQLARIKTALHDFEYEDLQITFVKDSERDVTMHVDTRGNGRSTDPPIAVGGARFNIPRIIYPLNLLIVRTTESKALLETKVEQKLRRFSESEGEKPELKTKMEKAEEKAIDAFF